MAVRERQERHLRDLTEPLPAADLESFLEGLSSKGEHDSSGLFTVNLTSSLAKLDAYRMEAAHHYVLPFVAAATLHGATVIDFSGSFSNLKIAFDGPALQASELRELGESVEPRLAELALGLHWARSVGAKVTLASKSDGHLNLLDFARDKAQVSTIESPRLNTLGTTILIRGCNTPNAPSPYSFLGRRCGFSPIVAWRQKRVTYPSQDETCASLRLACRKGEDPSVVLSSWVSLTSEHPQCSGRVWLSLDKSVIRFLLHGVNYPTEVRWNRFPGLQAALNYPAAQLDISRSKVVVDAKLESILNDIEEQVQRLLLPRLKRNYRGMLPYHRTIADRFLSV